VFLYVGHHASEGRQMLNGEWIGHDSVIGAGSVVTKSIPPGVVAAGSPCKVIRKITENDANNI